ncbi:MAG: helix-turn-helix domain-containing protein [Acetobacter sp.]|uniref:helix-turn-helix transcriptional regulator n=1 Tax=Acetobacter okinawensis TaxID=1076594 RepID=UPI00047152C6|nr:helix-turn-helix domain-containing protein [Acetobacter okinawensis]
MGEVLAPVQRKVMRASEAASYLGISETSFRSIAKKEIPPVQISEKRQVWLIEDLDSYLAARSGRSISPQQTNEWDSLCRRLTSNM